MIIEILNQDISFILISNIKSGYILRLYLYINILNQDLFIGLNISSSLTWEMKTGSFCLFRQLTGAFYVGLLDGLLGVAGMMTLLVIIDHSLIPS